MVAARFAEDPRLMSTGHGPQSIKDTHVPDRGRGRRLLYSFCVVFARRGSHARRQGEGAFESSAVEGDGALTRRLVDILLASVCAVCLFSPLILAASLAVLMGNPGAGVLSRTTGRGCAARSSPWSSCAPCTCVVGDGRQRDHRGGGRPGIPRWVVGCGRLRLDEFAAVAQHHPGRHVLFRPEGRGIQRSSNATRSCTERTLNVLPGPDPVPGDALLPVSRGADPGHRRPGTRSTTIGSSP